jgi:ribosomal protein S6
VTKYEGLFILNLANVEESVKETIDRISNVITTSGGKIENVQKLDKKVFTRAVDKHVTSGFYVNFVFDAQPDAIAKINGSFERDNEIWRIMITKVPKTGPAKIAA